MSFPILQVAVFPIGSVLCFTNLFSFMGSHLLSVDLRFCAIGVLFWRLSPVSVCSRLLVGSCEPPDVEFLVNNL